MTSSVLSIDLGDPAARGGPPAAPSRAAPIAGRFIAGPENALAAAAADGFLAEPPRYNPILLCGPSGTGKSLLARGLTQRFRHAHPQARIALTTAVDFARALASAIQTDGQDDFRHRYRRADLLTVDDLQTIDGRRAAQEELLHTIDAVLDAGGRVVAASSQPPGEIKSLLPQLASRLSGGLTVPLVPPGEAARCEIFLALAGKLGIRLEPESARRLAAGLSGPLPTLHAALLELAEGNGSPPDLAPDAIDDWLLARSEQPDVPLRSITAAVARQFGLRSADLKSPSRRQAVVLARGMAMQLARELTGRSYQQIGRHFGGRDHTTVLHGCRKIEQLLEDDPDIRQTYHELKEQLAPA